MRCYPKRYSHTAATQAFRMFLARASAMYFTPWSFSSEADKRSPIVCIDISCIFAFFLLYLCYDKISVFQLQEVFTMNLGYISIEQIPVFSNLMDPQVSDAIKEGEPITALGVAKNAALKKIDKDKMKLKPHNRYLDANVNVIERLLTKTKLTPEGKALLNNLKKEQV